MAVLEENNAVMLLVLTDNYLQRLSVEGSGVAVEVQHALTLIRAGKGLRVLFASPDPDSASKDIVPKLPEELKKLVKVVHNTHNPRRLAAAILQGCAL